MPKVERRTGFLCLGRKVKEWFCDVCGVKLQDVHSHDDKFYCQPCADAIDKEISHGWGHIDDVLKYSQLNKFFLDTLDNKEKNIDQCYNCEGLAISIKNGEMIYRIYYQVGSSTPLNSPFTCVPHSGFNELGEIKAQAECRHHWVTVASSRRTDTEAYEEYKQITSDRNVTIEKMLGIDDIDLQYACFGSTHYWCSKCGMYRHLNPQREHLLQEYGVKSS